MLAQSETEKLFYDTPRRREAVAEAREWLLECFPQFAEEIRLLNWIGVVRTTDAQHDGGWAGFRQTFGF